MQKTILIILVLVFNLSFSQSGKSEFGFRKLSGNVFDSLGPLPGQNILIKGTQIGTQTDLNGNFCLIIPRDKTIYIEAPFCFDKILFEVKPTDNSIELKTEKGNRNSKKAIRNWNKIKDDLISQLTEIYNTIEYQKEEKNICQ